MSASYRVAVCACIIACGGYDDTNPHPPDASGPNGFEDGIVDVARLPLRVASDVIELPDGRLVVAGDPRQALGAMRLFENGLLDPSFGESGTALVPLENPGAYTRAVRRAPDGKLLLLGQHSDPSIAIIVRLHEDGTFDQSFGAGGYLQIANAPKHVQPNAITILSDGRFYVAGSWFEYEPYRSMLWIARYGADGTLDTTFANGGTLLDPAVSDAQDLVVLSDGRIVIVEDYGSGVRTLRLNNDGTRDLTFGNAGFGTASVGGWRSVRGIGLLPDNRIVIGGLLDGTEGYDLGATRMTADGRVDPTFGTSGVARIDLALFDVAWDTVVAPDESIILVGSSYSNSPTVTPVAEAIVARFLPDGTRDPAFGTAGIARVPHDAYLWFYGSVIVQRDGRIVTLIANGDQLARFTSTGALDAR